MGVAFPDIDPYEILEVDKDSTPNEIKKSYKKLCLRLHPDKTINLAEDDKLASQLRFQQVQFAYSVLSDGIKRSRYDNTGSLDEVSEDGFDWKQYFDDIQEKITLEMIDEDKKKYQGSGEETDEIIESFIYYQGDFLTLFEVIPHLEFTKLAESRVFNIIQQAIEEGKIDPKLKKWEKYQKNRTKETTRLLKKLSKEAKQAEEMKKKITNKKVNNEDDLKALIMGRQKSRMDDLISNLENKYGKAKGSKREIDDDEFERVQSRMRKKRK